MHIRAEVELAMDKSRSERSQSQAPGKPPTMQDRVRAGSNAFEFSTLIDGVSTAVPERSEPDTTRTPDEPLSATTPNPSSALTEEDEFAVVLFKRVPKPEPSALGATQPKKSNRSARRRQRRLRLLLLCGILCVLAAGAMIWAEHAGFFLVR